MDDLQGEFLGETRENLVAMEADLLLLLCDPPVLEAAARIYRRLHTLHGTCSFLELPQLTELSRSSMALVSAMRDGRVPTNSTRVQALRALGVAVADILVSLEGTGTEGEAYAGLVDLLDGLVEERGAPAPEPPSLPAEPAPSSAPPAPAPVLVASLPDLVPAHEGDILDDFLVEAGDHLDRAERALQQLRPHGHNSRAAATLYRAFHSVRAACQFFVFEGIEALARAAEETLLPWREGEVDIPPAVLDAVEPLVPALRAMLLRVQTTGLEGEASYDALVATLRALPPPEARAAALPPAQAPAAPRAQPVSASPSSSPVEQQALVADFLAESRQALEQVEPDLIALEQEPGDSQRLARIFRCFHTLKGSCGLLGFPGLQEVTHAGESLLGRLRDGALRLDEAITAALLALVDHIRQALARIEEKGTDDGLSASDLVTRLLKLASGVPSAKAPPPSAPSPWTSLAVGAPAATEPTALHLAEPPETTLRIDVQVLDQLMTLVSELVLARNQIVQRSAGVESLLEPAQHLNRITAELQEGVMKTRMQPIGSLWNRLPRLVREVARTCGKEVRLVLEGRETELDRSLLAAINDPLVHLIRNSIDHGIELPEVRAARNKPAVGQISVRAFHHGGQVVVELADDGGGIDTDKIRARALARNLITPRQADAMSERELCELIMLPGFSTSEAVTQVSGRGVGMDVVKTNIEKLGGVVETHTRLYEGTTFVLRIPLTLAILPALLVRVQGQRFAVPQSSLVEVVRLVDGAGVDWIHSVPVYRLRHTLLPLVGLGQELTLCSDAIPLAGVASILVLHADRVRFGLVVDEVLDTEEIVVKPLSSLLSSQPVYAGAAILGDGKPVLILDIMGLAQRAHVLADLDGAESLTQAREAGPKLDEFLILKNRDGERFVLPLDQVVRLERFSPQRIERSGAQFVVQYGHDILPVLDLDQVLSSRTPEFVRDWVNCVVCSLGNRSVGLLVDTIVDIIADHPEVKGAASRPGVTCRAVVGERVAEMLDTSELVRLAYPRG